MKRLSKSKQYTEQMVTTYSKDMKDKMFEQAQKLDISQAELVRLAVQQYLEYLDLMNQAEDFGKLLEQDLIEE